MMCAVFHSWHVMFETNPVALNLNNLTPFEAKILANSDSCQELQEADKKFSSEPYTQNVGVM